VSSTPSRTRPPQASELDEAKAARYEARALARLGDVHGATAAFHAAEPPLGGPKPRALAVLDHARVLSMSGQSDEGSALAVEALRVGRAYGSERIVASVRTFRATLPADTAETRVLDEALTSLYEERP
jgi:hypothetical protein